MNGGSIVVFAASALVLAAASGVSCAQEAEMVYRARAGDTLIGVGERLLERPDDWRKLVRPNRVANPDRIQPGREIRIPLALLRSTAAEASVVQSVGDVRRGTARLDKGAVLSEGTAISTGKDGYATLRLADGSLLTVQRESEVKLESLRTYPGTQFVQSALRLESGRVEANARALAPGASRFEVRTRLATAAVRGTDFRVSAGGAGKNVTAEVLSGVVAVGDGTPANQAGAIQAGLLLAAGFGSVVDESRVPRPAAALLPAPDLTGVAALQERVVVRVRFPQLAGATGYRLQIAGDADFRTVLREDQLRAPDVRFSDLADGEYFLRARAADASGLEGRDASVSFRLKARPEPPFASFPAPRGKVRANEVAIEWTSNPDAASYRLQIAEDESFKRVVRSEAALRESRYTLSGVKFGNYFWRLASTKGANDHGPWGDPQAFSFLPPPANPEPPTESENSFTFRWPSEPGQRFLLQIASDEKFQQMLTSMETAEPMAQIARPRPGSYFLRVRATDADGFVGPFTRPQRFEVKPPPPPPPGVVDSSGRGVFSSDGRPLGRQ